LAIIEDDFDHEFHYQGRPVLPLKSGDGDGNVIYIGTLSKILAPGLRVGFVVAPRAMVGSLVDRRRHIDRQGDLGMEYAVAELFADGEVERHARRARRIYQARRDALLDALHRHLPAALQVTVPSGGIALWCEVAAGIDADRWSEATRAEGALVAAASQYHLRRLRRPFLRLVFAGLDEREMEEGVRRMALALAKLAN
jgi:GntR family transcriptional regulator/MocR family aminotransferase